LEGKQYTDKVFWDDKDEENWPYIPLVVGDQIRIWGSTRPFYKDKANKEITFALWAAMTPDERIITNDQPSEDSHYWLRKYYELSVDVEDRLVTLSAVRPGFKWLNVVFADNLDLAEADGYALSCEAEEAINLAVGQKVVVQRMWQRQQIIVTKIETEEGALLYG
jgi:predicted GNAT superfamily acetyltransferase